MFIEIGLTSLTASNNILKGKILFFSSSNTPTKGVEIQGTIKSIEWSNAVRTTDDGEFEITFPKEAAGKKVQLLIDTKDRYNQTIEIVNQKVVDEFRLAVIKDLLLIGLTTENIISCCSNQ